MSPRTPVDEMAGAETDRSAPKSDAMSRAHRTVDETPDETTTTDDPPPMSFQEAAKAALAKHSTGEQAEPDGDSTETDDDEETETPPAAGAKGKATVAAEETETEETEGQETPTFLSDAEYAKLEKDAKGDPTVLRKSLAAAFTKKTQALATDRKALDRVKPYVDLIEAYEDDPEGTLSALAERNGLRVVKAEGEEPTAEATDTDADQLLAEARAELGDDLDYLAEPLARLLGKLLPKIAEAKAQAAVKPLQAEAEAHRTERAEKRTEQVFEQLTAKHADWKTHEAAMLELSQKLTPSPDMTELEYLEHIYTLVTAPDRAAATEAAIAAEADKRTAARLKKQREAADSYETPTRSMPHNKVTTARPENAGFREAFEAAKRGERWEE